MLDILLLTICAVIIGAEGWEEIEDFGKERLKWLQQYGDFEKDIPSHDTIARVISIVSPKQFQPCFSEWMKACHFARKGSNVAIDGKTLKSAYRNRVKPGTYPVFIKRGAKVV